LRREPVCSERCSMCWVCLFFFFFQAEDGIRDPLVTGVQTCALPICGGKIEAAVKTILKAVERGGDAAVSRYTRRFDKVSLKPGQFRVSPDEIKEAYYKIRKEEGDALRYAAHRITVFHDKEKPRVQTWMWQDGTIPLGQTILPLDVIGLYVPGGKAVYPSSV